MVWTHSRWNWIARFLCSDIRDWHFSTVDKRTEKNSDCFITTYNPVSRGTQGQQAWCPDEPRLKFSLLSVWNSQSHTCLSAFQLYGLFSKALGCQDTRFMILKILFSSSVFSLSLKAISTSYCVRQDMTHKRTPKHSSQCVATYSYCTMGSVHNCFIVFSNSIFAKNKSHI